MSATYERNRQLIRQWQILRSLERHPATIAALANEHGVCWRTVARDLEALQAAGFPLYDDVDDDGAKRWHLLTKGVTPARAA